MFELITHHYLIYLMSSKPIQLHITDIMIKKEYDIHQRLRLRLRLRV